jgi:hypothetical protein
MPETLDTSMHVRIDTHRTGDDQKPYGFVVDWIPWDSGFRGTDLALRDVITAIDDNVFTPQDKNFDFGQYGEEQYWDQAGAKDGTPTTLTVLRDGKTLKITGQVRADRFYTNDDGQRTIGLDGPQQMGRDGFDSAWSFWAEEITRLLADAPRALYQQNTRQYLEALEEYRPRVEYLVQNYPKSNFARAMQADYDKAVELIRGRKYDLTADDLAYRSLNAHRVEAASALAVKARDEMVAKLGAEPLSALPWIDPVRGNRQEIAGKIVDLPKLEDEVSEAAHGWYVARGADDRIFLADTRATAFMAIFRAMERFKQRIAPDLNEDFELIARIADRPQMVASGQSVYTGLLLEPMAALVDGKMFVDLSSGSLDAPFAGEAEAVKPPTVDTRGDMTPSETFVSFINALKLGDQDLWQSFFARWSCEPAAIGAEWVYDAQGGPVPNAHNEDYVIARRVIMSTVYDVRVVSEGAPKIVYDKGGTRVEMVDLDVDPIGLFEGEYRSFRSVDVHRLWAMQRVNRGPWKIVFDQGI